MFHSMEIRKPARFVRLRRLEPGSRVSTRARQDSLPGEVRVRGLMHARGEFYPTPQEAIKHGNRDKTLADSLA